MLFGIFNKKSVEETEVSTTPDIDFNEIRKNLDEAQSRLSSVVEETKHVAINVAKGLEQRILTVEEKLAIILNIMSEAAILTDSEGYIVEWNNSAKNLMGFSKAKILGKNIRSIFGEDIRTLASQGPYTRKSYAATDGALRVPIDFKITPLLNFNSRCSYIIICKGIQ